MTLLKTEKKQKRSFTKIISLGKNISNFKVFNILSLDDLQSTAWTWSPTQKADVILLRDNDKEAYRPSGGRYSVFVRECLLDSNPAVLTSKPFSKRHNKISMKVEKLSDWVCIGTWFIKFS